MGNSCVLHFANCPYTDLFLNRVEGTTLAVSAMAALLTALITLQKETWSIGLTTANSALAVLAVLLLGTFLVLSGLLLHALIAKVVADDKIEFMALWKLDQNTGPDDLTDLRKWRWRLVEIGYRKMRLISDKEQTIQNLKIEHLSMGEELQMQGMMHRSGYKRMSVQQYRESARIICPPMDMQKLGELNDLPSTLFTFNITATSESGTRKSFVLGAESLDGRDRCCALVSEERCAKCDTALALGDDFCRKCGSRRPALERAPQRRGHRVAESFTPRSRDRLVSEISFGLTDSSRGAAGASGLLVHPGDIELPERGSLRPRSSQE